MLLNHFMLLVALGSTSVLSLITKRDAPPDNTDGAYKVAFKCTNSMYPGAARGGPSDYTHNDELKLAVADGSLRSPDECHEQDGHPAIAECTFNDDAFEGGSLIVHVYNDPGNCHLDFGYKGESFTAKSDKCGHDDGGFEPFTSEKTAICYFDA